MGKTGFAIIDAPGLHGDYARVYETVGTLEEARRVARGMRGVTIIRDASAVKGGTVTKQWAAQRDVDGLI